MKWKLWKVKRYQAKGFSFLSDMSTSDVKYLSRGVKVYFCIISPHARKRQRALEPGVFYGKRKQFACYNLPYSPNENVSLFDSCITKVWLIVLRSLLPLSIVVIIVVLYLFVANFSRFMSARQNFCWFLTQTDATPRKPFGNKSWIYVAHQPIRYLRGANTQSPPQSHLPNIS